MGMLDISSMVSPAKKPGGAVENLGKDFETWKFDQNWASDPGNDVVPMMLDSIYNNPQALAALGALTQAAHQAALAVQPLALAAAAVAAAVQALSCCAGNNRWDNFTKTRHDP